MEVVGGWKWLVMEVVGDGSDWWMVVLSGW